MASAGTASLSASRVTCAASMSPSYVTVITLPIRSPSARSLSATSEMSKDTMPASALWMVMEFMEASMITPSMLVPSALSASLLSAEVSTGVSVAASLCRDSDAGVSVACGWLEQPYSERAAVQAKAAINCFFIIISPLK